MSEPKRTSEYLLLVRGTDWEGKLSPDEIQEFMAQFNTWYDGLNERGVLLGARPLGHEGKVVSGKGTPTVADGPFAESKEAIGGYFLLHLDSFDEALEIAKSCPMVRFGGAVEVRPVIERCSTMQHASEMLAGAAE